MVTEVSVNVFSSSICLLHLYQWSRSSPPSRPPPVQRLPAPPTLPAGNVGGACCQLAEGGGSLPEQMKEPPKAEGAGDGRGGGTSPPPGAGRSFLCWWPLMLRRKCDMMTERHFILQKLRQISVFVQWRSERKGGCRCGKVVKVSRMALKSSSVFSCRSSSSGVGGKWFSRHSEWTALNNCSLDILGR